jgi:5-methylcytosine-specific restriction protein A
MEFAYLTYDSVIAAIDECDALGREAFLKKYGAKPSRTRLLLHNGTAYETVAISTAARAKLDKKSVSVDGGMNATKVRQITAHLRSLGFILVDSPPKLAVAGVDDGLLRATCELRFETGRWVITLHSAGGAKGKPDERNPDYKLALFAIVTRLRSSGATIQDVLVDSTQTANLTKAQRRLLKSSPITPTNPISVEGIVEAVTKTMARVGSSAAKGGNSRKQIRIEFSGPTLETREDVSQHIINGSSTTAAVFVLTWNPSKWKLTKKELDPVIKVTAQGGIHNGRWATGNRKSGIEAGDHVFLFRQETERGLVAYGRALGGIFQEAHWNGSGKDANYIEIGWVEWVNTDERLPVERMKAVTEDSNWDSVLAGGIKLSEDDGRRLLAEWNIDAKPRPNDRSGDEAVQGLREGAKTTVEVNRYERNRRARSECIAHHGAICAACEMDFAARYGGIGYGFIHVHHVVPIASIGESYVLDPIKDLIPLCPNCHAMIHHGVSHPRSVAELRKLLSS